MKRIISYIILIVCMHGGVSTLYGASSNTCGTAPLLVMCETNTMNKPNSYNNTLNPAGCNTSNQDDAWARFVATGTTTGVAYYTTNDAVLHIMSGTCGSQASVACADNWLGGGEILTFASTIGVTYYVYVERWNSNVQMSGQISVWPIATNDICASATPITVNGACISDACQGENGEGAVSCGGANNSNAASTWYSFVAPANGSVDITATLNLYGYYAPIVVYASCGGAEIQCDYTGGDPLVASVSGLTCGDTYYVDLAVPVTVAYPATPWEIVSNYQLCITTTGGLGCIPGGDAYGVYSTSDPVVGTITDCEIYAVGGTGGNGFEVAKGAGPTDDGYSSVAVSNYAVITAENISCLNSDMDFTTADGSPVWPAGALGTNATIADPPDVGTVNNNQYSATLGRRDITFVGDEASVSMPSQTYSSTVGTVLPNGFCGVDDIIVVAGYTGTVATANITVTVNTTHTQANDLLVFLQASNGDILNLMWQTGWTGAGLTNTIFSDAGATKLLGQNNSPWTATYQVEDLGDQPGCGYTRNRATFGAIGGGALNPNGNWTLHVLDAVFGGNTGTFDDWSITFPAYTVSGPTNQSHVYTGFVNIQMAKPSPGDVLGVDNVCPGTYNFASSEAGTAGYSYQWSVLPVAGVTIATPTDSATDITFTNSVDHTVSLAITSECCGPLVQIDSVVTILPLPAVDPGTDISLCAGATDTLVVTTPTGGYSYGWYDAATGGTYLGGGTSYIVNPVLLGVTTYYLETISNTGCVSATRDAVTITGTDTPPSITGNNFQACNPGNITVCVNAPISGATYSWWTLAAGGVLLQSSTAFCYDVNVATSPATQSVWVEVTESGCNVSTTRTEGIAETTGGGSTNTTWSGAVDTDWFVDGNWSDCVPTPLIDAIFPSGALTNECTIDIINDAPAECRSISIDAARTLSFNGALTTLNVYGNWTNNGSVSATTGIIGFLGTTAQTIGGTSSTSFYNLKIDNSTALSAVTLLLNTTVTNQLTLTNGELVSSLANRITLTAAALTSPPRGSATSFVSTVMDRVVTASSGEVYEFPVGSTIDSRWRPVTITTTDATAQTWTIEYVDTDPNGFGIVYDLTDSIRMMNTFYYYNITRATAVGALDVKMWYDDAEMAALTGPETNMLIGHWNSGITMWDDWNKDALVDWAWSGTNNWVEVKNISGFSPVGPGKGVTPAPLPIKLLYFDAAYNYQTEDVDLTWATASEEHNDFFTIEKSRDALDFELVVTVPGAPAGSSNQTLQYTAVDEEPYEGLSYYRLKQTDYDGQYEYSKLVAVNVYKNVGLTIRPNPATNYLEIHISQTGTNSLSTATLENSAQIEIFSSDGQNVYNQLVTGGQNSEFKIDISMLSQGMYNLTLLNNGEFYSIKFIKE